MKRRLIDRMIDHKPHELEHDRLLRIARELGAGKNLAEPDRIFAALCLRFDAWAAEQRHERRKHTTRALAERAADLVRVQGLSRKAAIYTVMGGREDDRKLFARIGRALDRRGGVDHLLATKRSRKRR